MNKSESAYCDLVSASKAMYMYLGITYSIRTAVSRWLGHTKDLVIGSELHKDIQCYNMDSEKLWIGRLTKGQELGHWYS